MVGMQLLVVDVDEELDELDELDEDDEATGFLPLVRFLGCLSSLLFLQLPHQLVPGQRNLHGFIAQKVGR